MIQNRLFFNLLVKFANAQRSEAMSVANKAKRVKLFHLDTNYLWKVWFQMKLWCFVACKAETRVKLSAEEGNFLRRFTISPLARIHCSNIVSNGKNHE